jgi:hypothetical protein
MFWRTLKLPALTLPLLLILILTSACGGEPKPNTPGVAYKADWRIVSAVVGPLPTTAASQTMSEADYKRDCRHVRWQDYASNLGAHKGEDVYFAGWVGGAGPAADTIAGGRAALDKSIFRSTDLNAFELGVGSLPQYDEAVDVLWPGPLPASVVPTRLRSGNGVVDVYVEVWGESLGADGPKGNSGLLCPLVMARYITCYAK